jgi:hypothetical protein
MSSLEYQDDLPPACRAAREAFGLALANGEQATDPHLATCDACARATTAMRRIWEGSAEVMTSLREELDPARSERLLAGSLLRAKQEQPPAVILPFRRAPRSTSSNVGFGLALGFALAAGLAAIVFVGPRLFEQPKEPIAVEPAPTPAGPVQVRLASAKGDVSMVPADGTLIQTPKAGDALPPGLFAATGGAALSIEGQGLLAVRGDATILIGGSHGDPELSVAKGEIFVDLPKGTIKTFLVRTPTGAVRVTGTQFDVKAGPSSTHVKVTRGSVKVTGANGETAVTEGQSATISKDGIPVMDLVVSPTDDAYGWVRDLAPDRAPAEPIGLAIKDRPGLHATPAATPGEATGVLALPGLDPLVVNDAMEKRQASMRYCYDKALMDDANLVVKADLHFTVDDYGAAKNFRIDGLPKGQEALEACLMDAAQKAVFPKSAPGTQVDVNYHLRFEPAPTPTERPR